MSCGKMWNVKTKSVPAGTLWKTQLRWLTTTPNSRTLAEFFHFQCEIAGRWGSVHDGGRPDRRQTPTCYKVGSPRCQALVNLGDRLARFWSGSWESETPQTRQDQVGSRGLDPAGRHRLRVPSGPAMRPNQLQWEGSIRSARRRGG